MSDDQLPGFGNFARLFRWSGADVKLAGASGPLPPGARGRRPDPTDDDAYSNMMMGRGIFGPYAGALQQWFAEPRDRTELYRIYDEMDKTDLAGSVLDMYAEDSTPIDEETDKTMWVVSKNPEMVREANALLGRLRMEEEIVGLARDVAKYGDDFERSVYTDAAEDGGLKRLVPIDPKEVLRHETKEGKLEGYRQHGKKFRDGNSIDSFPWDFVHFRLRGRNRRYPYGTSILQNAIRPWRQLIILEDWLLNYQVSRHPDRNLFIIDSGSASDQETHDVARRFKNKLKRHMVIDPAAASGKNMSYTFNPITPLEDLVMAIRTGSQTRVEKLSGSANAADIGPINLAIMKFFAAVRAPKGFFGIDDPTMPPVNMKASLCNQDIRYARTCVRIQRALKAGITYAAEFNFMLKQGKDVEKGSKYDWLKQGNAFQVQMAKVSHLAELEKLEVAQLRQQVAAGLTDMARDNAAYKAAEWTAYILKNYMMISDDEIESVLRTSEEMAAVQDASAETGGPPGGMYASRDVVPGTGGLTERQLDAREKVRSRGVLHDGSISRSERRKLSEVIRANPKIQHLIKLGALLHRDLEAGDHVSEYMLPTKKQITDGGLKDSLTQEDFDAMMLEAKFESRRAGA